MVYMTAFGEDKKTIMEDMTTREPQGAQGVSLQPRR